MPNTHPFVGRHVTAELFGIDSDSLDNEKLLDDAMTIAISLSNAHTEGKVIKKFTPVGVSIVYLLSESHASIHTYPEAGALFFDAFTCGNHCNPNNILDSICNCLLPRYVQKKEMLREPTEGVI